MAEKEVLDSTSAGFVKAFSFALKQFRFYSEKHPITEQAVQSLAAETEKLFVVKKRLDLGTMRHRLIVDGAMTGEKDSHAVDLAKELEKMGIEGLAFEKGIDAQEITAFVSLMSTRAKTLEDKGGFKNLFESASFQHIKLSTGKFQLVEEGQVLSSEGAQGGPGGETAAPSGPAASIADIIQRIRSDQAEGGSPKASHIQLDCEKIVVQLEKNPVEMAQAAIEETKDAKQLEVVIRKIIHFLIEGLIGFLIEQGKDITKALEKLAKELEKAIDRAGLGEEFNSLKNKIPTIFEEGTDELRIQMMVRAFKKKPEDMKGLQKLAGKLFKDQEVRGRLAPSLREEMSGVGLPRTDFQLMFEDIDEKQAAKKKRVTIDADELAKLRRKAAMAGEGGGGGGELKKKVERLEREKKVILDQKERVDSVIRNLAEGVLVVDKEGKVVLMNPAAEKLLGVKQKEKQGRLVTEGLSPGHLVAITKGELKDLEANVSKNVEIVSLNDETTRILQASTAVIENEDGKTVGMVSVLSDVTRQKEVEEMKSKFVANVSHELRTPLVAIQKSLALILGKEVGEVNEEQHKFLSIAHRNIDRLSRLINDLLDVSKLEAGRMNLRPKKFPIKEIALHVFSTVEIWAKDKKISLKLDFERDDLELEGDADRLTQVMTNLVGNAIKFTPENGSICVDAKQVLDPETRAPMVEVGVQDTGIGIAPEDQKKLFNKFVQVSLAQPQGVSSTGLGLAIAREIIELHSGKIWVESGAEKGSRFAFRLPVSYKLNEKQLSRAA